MARGHGQGGERTCRTTPLIALALGLIAVAPAVAGGERDAGRLKVVMTGLEGTDGKVIFQLARTKADFESEDENRSVYADAVIRDGRAEYVFPNVEVGVYAVKAFHDANDNEKLDTNFLGIPKESFGFSNNKMGRFGPPGYEDCRFEFSGPSVTIEIEAKRF